MWSHRQELVSGAPAQDLFAVLSDVGSWPEWNSGLEHAELSGPFAEGAPGLMVMPGGQRLAFRLSWVSVNEGFEDATEVPEAGIVVYVRHSLEPLVDGRTRVVYQCTIDGPGADEAGPQIGAAVTADFPEVMAALSARAAVRAGGLRGTGLDGLDRTGP